MVFLPADGGEFFFVGGLCEFRVGSLRCRDGKFVGRGLCEKLVSSLLPRDDKFVGRGLW